MRLPPGLTAVSGEPARADTDDDGEDEEAAPADGEQDEYRSNAEDKYH